MSATSSPQASLAGRTILMEWLLLPGTGKAIEVKAGQILRIAQTSGNQ